MLFCIVTMDYCLQ